MQALCSLFNNYAPLIMKLFITVRLNIPLCVQLGSFDVDFFICIDNISLPLVLLL